MTTRLTGLCHGEPSVLLAFTQTAGALCPAGGRPPRVLLLPEAAPRLAIVLREAPGLPIGVGRAGAVLAILEGPLFNATEVDTLIGHAGASGADGDAARVAALYAAKGREGFGALDCGGAIVLYDANKDELVLVRDRAGHAPLFLREGAEDFAFATHLPALAVPGEAPAIDARALDFLLAKGFVPSPSTLIAGVQQLPPAHAAIKRAQGPAVVSRYFLPTFTPKHTRAFGLLERFETLFTAALARRLGTARRPGVLLSGGIDSGLVAAGLVKLIDQRPEAFTFDYAAYDGPHNESGPALALAQHLGIVHHKISITPQAVADRFDALVLQHGQPFTFGLHSFNLADPAALGIDALFTGAGADAYGISNLGHRWARLQRRPLSARRAALTLLWASGAVWRKGAETARMLAEANALGVPPNLSSTLLPAPARELLAADPAGLADGRAAIQGLLTQAIESLGLPPGHDQYRAAAARFFSADCLLAWYHAWGRTAGIALSHPLFDTALTAFVARHRNESLGKPFLRLLGRRLLPERAATAPKLHQTIPVGVWMRGPLKDFAGDRLTPAAVKAAGLFRPEAVTRLFAEHVAGRADRTWALWAILTAQSWHRQLSAMPPKAARAPGHDGPPAADASILAGPGRRTPRLRRRGG